MLIDSKGTEKYPVILQEKKEDEWQDLSKSNEKQLFSVPDDKLKKLLYSFTVWLSNNDEAKTHIDALKKQSAEIINTFLKKDSLDNILEEDFYQNVFDYTRRLEGPAYIRLGEPRIRANLKDIKRNFQYLIESEEDPFEKTHAILDGHLKIPHFAKAFWSPIFQSFYPDLMPNWNNKTEKFLNKIGVSISSGKLPIQEKYKLLSNAFKYLQSLNPEHDFFSLNHLMHYGISVDEGKKLLNDILGDTDSYIKYWQIAPGEKARLWDDFKKNSIVAIGFDKMNLDLSHKSKEELLNLYYEYYPKAKKQSAKILTSHLYNFITLKPGDKFIINKGKSYLLGSGEVTSHYIYRPSRNEYRHTIDVNYNKICEKEVILPKTIANKFGKTILQLDKDTFQQLDILLSSQSDQSVWWVNQGGTLNTEKAGDYIWAPLRSKNGRSISHWESLSEIKKEDIILHYANGAIRYVSKVLQEAVIQKKPVDLPSGHWEDEGRLVKTQYTPLNPPIQLNVFQEKLMTLNLSKGPLNESGGVKQGYLFKLNNEALGAIVGSQTETTWPDYIKIEPSGIPPNPDYKIEDCANETGLPIEQIASWKRAIERKGQAILYGPPGTGKTYIAERLGKHLISTGDGFCDLVQFHPTYSYEDFIQGIRPHADDKGNLCYPTVKGRFLEFCEKAGKRIKSCVLIIDEINRANLSRVFGELMYLLEYRGKTIPLASGGVFKIPQNVRIIGTMNTADRSIALVDHALRRRFAFFSLSPNYELLKRYHIETGFKVDGLIDILQQLNNQIGDRHYEVGITYFLRHDIEKQIKDIWKMEIEPYLEEYFFDQPEKVMEYRWDKIGSKILT